MIRHVVLLELVPGASTAGLVSGVLALGERIPSIRGIEAGPGLEPGNASFGIVATFDDIEGYREYMSHPAHKAFAAEHVVPVMVGGSQVQFQI